MNGIGRPAALLTLLLLAASCATAPRVAASRDRFPLDPREGLTGPFPNSIESGWAALLAGHPARAREEFRKAQVGEAAIAANIGSIEALVEEASLSEALSACRVALAARETTLPLFVACGEAHARSGQPLEGWELYRDGLARVGYRPGLAARAAELRPLAVGQLQRRAEEAAGKGDWKAARQEIAQAIEIDPRSAPARETAGDIELGAGDRAAALARFREASDLSPNDRALWKKVASVALELSDYAAAVPALDKLAAEDPRYGAEAAQARLAFRVANWPAAERTAARSASLTRGEAALLLWWMVPEVRATRVTEGVIASDVVGRPNGPEMTRVFSLGLLDVDRETHRANPDGILTLSAAARAYLQLLALLRPSAPLACLDGRPAESFARSEAIRAARNCRIIGEKEGPPVSGAAFTRAVDRTRSIAGVAEGAPGENGGGRL